VWLYSYFGNSNHGNATLAAFLFLFSCCTSCVTPESSVLFSLSIPFRTQEGGGASGPYKRRNINLSKNLLDKMTTEDREQQHGTKKNIKNITESFFYLDTKSLTKSIWYFLSRPFSNLKEMMKISTAILSALCSLSLSGPSSLYRWGKLLKLGVGSCVCWDCMKLA
jgi:hypothetical protein